MYLGYHLFLYFLSLIPSRKLNPNFENLPAVSLIITVHNEENFIKKKIENTKALDYDHSKLEIIVVDDNSTDRTREIVRKFRNVKLIQKKERSGKARSVNLGIKQATHQIVVISDGNALLNNKALKVVAGYFHHTKVGAVTGIFKPITKMGDGIEKSEGLFWKMDKSALKHESDWDSAVYTCGQITAFRKNLISKVSENNLTEDFEFALSVRKKGYRVICDPRAISQKYSCGNERDMLIQRKRRGIGTLQTLFRFKSLLFNLKYGLFSLVFLPSHKLLQMLSPFLIIILIALLAIGLILDGSIFFLILMLGLGIFMILSLLAFAFKKQLPFLSIFYLFWFGQWIVLTSWMDYWTGNYTVTWQQIQSSR
ncbi:glycosyltransferase [Patescibacteria group bacterium]